MRERAEIVLTTMQAARDYTQENVQPLLEEHSEGEDRFVQEGIPNFAAQTIFSNFRQQNPRFQDFLYKEAALNPTNPEDFADAFELEVLAQLRQPLRDDTELLSGYRRLNGNKLFYLARPLVMKDASCLACHGSPANAPRSLIETYGDKNGFGWQLGDIIATQMIYVPADEIFDQGRQNLRAVTRTLLSILGALVFVINLLLWRTVIKPLKTLTGVSEAISSGSLGRRQNEKLQVLNLEALTRRQDESGKLARAFQYMVHVLTQREQDLQRLVTERTRSLEQESNERQAAQSALQTYTHAINHDLRNLAMGIANLVQGTLFQTSSREIKGLASDGMTTQRWISVNAMTLEMIRKSCDRQLKLMNALMEVQSLDIWRIALQVETVDLSRLVEELRVAYRARMVAAGAVLRNDIAEDLPTVCVDPSQLLRVFENLIDNALKHNPQGVEINIGAAVVPDDPALIRCVVSDQGVGIGPQRRAELFNLYSRDRTDPQSSGYGLGLYICRKILEAHGGEIGFSESSTEGAEFWFTLPCDRTKPTCE